MIMQQFSNFQFYFGPDLLKRDKVACEGMINSMDDCHSL